MTNPQPPTPRRQTRSPGAGVCLIIGLLFVVFAGYATIAPLSVPAAGGKYDCGSVLRQHGDRFSRGVCGNVFDQQLATAGTALLMGLIIAFGGAIAFRSGEPAE